MFEIHITTNKLKESEIEQFQKFCQSIDAKPILIELAEGETKQQPMISKVYTNIGKGQIKSKIELLEQQFTASSYDIARTKVEVPLDYMNLGKSEFPDYKGQYYEWHGKVEFENLDKFHETLSTFHNTHVSNNALKNQPNRRFVTVRNLYNKNSFTNHVTSVKNRLQKEGFRLIKDEYEYCVFDSNKTIDKGWMDVPEITDEHYLNLLAFEGFLRRMSDKNEKFLLKGSILMRQYLSDINIRETMDLDFIYAERIHTEQEARSIFTKWITDVTETDVNDNISYTSFKENEFWRRIDYAMDDDFPTTNTDLSCLINNQLLDVVPLDITWNLPLEENSIPLVYKPQIGESFTIPHTVPLATQIAWKLHQTIVRPRAKDLIDIILILKSNDLSNDQLDSISKVFVAECIKDKIDPLRLNYFSTGEVYLFLKKNKKNLDEHPQKYWDLDTPFGFDINSAMKLHFVDEIYNIDFEFKDVQELVKAFEISLNQSEIVTNIRSLTNQNTNIRLKDKLNYFLKKIKSTN